MPLKTLFGTFAAFYYFFLALLPEVSSRVYRRSLLLLRRFQRSRHVVVALLNTDPSRRRRIRRAKRAWCFPRNQFWFETLLSGSFVEEWWKENFRISRNTFRFIVRLVGPDLAKEDTNMRKALPVEKRIAVALWRLATGDTYRSTSLQFGVGRTTALKAKKEFCKILAKKAGEFIKFPITEAEAAAKICSFTNKSSFPQVVGAIDGTHIPLKSVPRRERVEYFNRKQDYSIVLQGVADASFRFLDVSTGYPGSIHDARILRMSRLHWKVSQGDWLKGPIKQIGPVEVGPLLVGDSAYPLSLWLMKPFKQTATLIEEQVHYNKALRQARVVVEQAYGILKGRWRNLLKPMEEHISTASTTIMACCVLHNICINVGDPTEINLECDEDSDSVIIPDVHEQMGVNLRTLLAEPEL